MSLSLLSQTKLSENPSSNYPLSSRAAINQLSSLRNAYSQGRESQLKQNLTSPLTNTQGISLLSQKSDTSWQEISLEQLKLANMFSETKRSVAGLNVSLQNFSLNKDAKESISISPELGAGLMSLKLDSREIISSPLLKKDLKDSKVASLEGMQLISPPNRTLNAEIKFEDAKHKIQSINLNKLAKAANVDAESEGKNNIHGIFGKLPWQLAKLETNRSGDLRITYSFNTADNQALKKSLGEAEFKMSYTLSKADTDKAAQLETSISVENKGNEKSANKGLFPLIGLAWHPYFKSSPDTSFTSSVKAQLEKNKEQLPSGLLKNISDADPLNTQRKADKQSGALDDHFLVKPNDAQGKAATTVIRNADHEISISQDAKTLPFLTLYNGADNKLCVEPLSSSPNAGNMGGVLKKNHAAEYDPKSIILKSGETFNAAFTIKSQSLSSG